MSANYEDIIDSSTYGEDEVQNTNNIKDVIYVLGVDSNGDLIVRNPNNIGASVTLSWLNNIPRLRIGGEGDGTVNGFQIQGAGDVVLLDVDNDGSLNVPRNLNIENIATALAYYVNNPSNPLAQIQLSWLSNVARIRIGGSGEGSVNGFQIQGMGDVVLLDLTNDGDLTVNSLTTTNGITIQNRIGAVLQNGWVNISGYATASYYKDEMNRVYLTGALSSGVITSGTTIFTLPVGYRPEGREIHNVLCGGDVVGRVDIQVDGRVTVQNIPSNTYLSLADVSFRAV